MAFALVTSVKSATNQNGTTSASVDTTGADLLVMVVGRYSGTGAPTISDSKGNTWTALTETTEGGFQGVRIYYAKNATVGTGHTFTASGAICYAAICVAAFSGSNTTAPFDVENGSNGSSAATSQPGSITPSEDNCLVIAGSNAYSNHISSVDSGYTLELDQYGGEALASALAYKIQTAAAATNPTLTHSGTGPYADAIASFKAAGAAPSGNPWYYYAQQQAVCG